MDGVLFKSRATDGETYHYDLDEICFRNTVVNGTAITAMHMLDTIMFYYHQPISAFMLIFTVPPASPS